MRRIIAIILLVVVLVILANTNPQRSEYVNWINHKAMDQSSNLLEKGILSLAGEKVFDLGTTESNYILFSVYKTDFSDVGMGKVTCIGIFNQFIPISKN